MISIIVPIYKVEKYLETCINSILSQSYKNLEVILVDDGSPDACPTICDEYARKDNRIKVVHKINGGLVSARKSGMSIASGEYILNVDSDDYISETLLETLDKALIVNGYPDVVAFGFSKFDDETKTVIAKCAFNESCLYLGENVESLRKKYLYDDDEPGLNGGIIPHAIWAKLVKRDLYKRCQMFVPDKISKGEDTLFTFHLLMNCSSIYISEDTGYHYRFRQSSMINTLNNSDFDNLFFLAESLLQISDNNQEYKNQIAVYLYCRVKSLACSAVHKSKNFCTFYEYIKSSNSILNSELFDTKIPVHNIRLKERVMMNIIINSRWKLFYRISKL